VRSILLVLFVLVSLPVLSPPAPADAATSFNCPRASTIVGYTAAGRGVRIDTLWGVSDPARVEALLRQHGWEAQIGEADAVQVVYAEPSRYLLIASRRGCAVAHRYLEEAEARRLVAG